MTPTSDYCASPMSFPNVPELLSCSFDDVSTDPSPSPPMVSARITPSANPEYSPELLQMYRSLNNRYNTYPSPTSYPQYIDPQPKIVNSIEFTDLTQPQLEDRRRRRSNTQQDKESVSNMRIVSATKPNSPTCILTAVSVDEHKTGPLSVLFANAKRSTFNTSNTNSRSSSLSTGTSRDLTAILTARTRN